VWAEWREKQANFVHWRKKKRNLRDLRFWAVLKKQFFKMLPTLRSNCVVLDVGCGGGTYLKGVMTRSGCFGVGVDPRPIKSGIPLVKAVAEYLPFREGCFDMIFTTASIDHFQNPQRFVSETDSVLRRNGYFAVLQSLDNKEDNDPTHLHAFSERTLLFLFRRFHVIVKKRVHSFSWLIPNWLCNYFSPVYSNAVSLMLMVKQVEDTEFIMNWELEEQLLHA
jgi:SAM-dependent methyltransferase